MHAITLSEGQRELVAIEAEHIANKAASEESKATFSRLASAAAAGKLPEELSSALGELLALGLASGRIRAVHGPHGELDAVNLYRRTPQGKAYHAQFDDVNAMFRAFKDQRIHQVSLSARGPGMFSLTLETEAARVVVSLTQSGVDVRSVEVAV